MYDKLENIPEKTFLFVLGLSTLGGIFNYFRRIKDRATLKRKVYFFLFDTIASTGIGVSTFFVLSGYGLNELMSVGIASFLAHVGTRSFYIVELVIGDKMKVDVLKEKAKEKL